MNGDEQVNNTIRFLSAADRINYGDLLFPLIFKRYLDDYHFNKYTFVNYGIVKSDLSHIGALKTHSFKRLEYDVRNGDKIVIGGGEVLSAEWTSLYAFINPLFKRALQYGPIKYIENLFQFSKLLLSNKKVRAPFCFVENDFGRQFLRIYYSSVGGGGKLKIKKYHYLKDKLRRASIISLRDKRSFNFLSGIKDGKLRLVPDSALLMSFFYSTTNLNELKTLPTVPSKYFFVQSGRYKGPEDLKSFADQLSRLRDYFDVDIVLSPIGTAPGHEDDNVLKRLLAFNPNFLYIEPDNIFDTMYLIANCKMYIGTSLHGAITAMSYCRPYVGLNLKIKKLESYSQTWVSDDYLNINFTDLNPSTIIKYEDLFNQNYDREKLISQQKLIMANFDYIIND